MSLLGPMWNTEKIRRHMVRAKWGSKDHRHLSLSSELLCLSQLSNLLTQALLSFLLIPIKHAPPPSHICALPNLHQQTWAFIPGATFAGKPRGCYEQVLPFPCASSSHTRTMSLTVSSFRSLHFSPYSLQLLSSHQATLVVIFHNDTETSFVPALQPATVSSSSPYCICSPNFFFLSAAHYPSIPPPPASHTLPLTLQAN